jgi:hypothetical protein
MCTKQSNAKPHLVFRVLAYLGVVVTFCEYDRRVFGCDVGVSHVRERVIEDQPVPEY